MEELLSRVVEQHPVHFQQVDLLVGDFINIGGADVAPPCDPKPASRHFAHRRAPCFFAAAAGSVLSSAAQMN